MPNSKENHQVSDEKDPYLVLLDSQIGRTKDLSTEHLSCRQGALNHAWHLVQPDWKPIKGVRAVAQQCSRCFAIKRSNVSIRYGELLAPPTYEYPEGYQLARHPGDKGRIVSAQAVRAAFVKRSESTNLPAMIVLHEPDPDSDS
jgi:hypothetical protein